MNNNFTKINRETVISQVYNDLLNKILDNTFSEGKKLPSENQLAILYGVSRVTVRAALQKLETLGLVEVKVGQGTIVKEPNFINIMSSISEIVASSDMLPYLEEFRIYIENACIELTIKNADNNEIIELEKLANNLMVFANSKDPNGFIEADYLFHYQLAVLSHNKIFELVYSSIKDIFYKSITSNISEILKSDINYLVLSANRHIKLVEEIKDRNLDNAMSLSSFIIKKFNEKEFYYNE
ncbi:MAG: FadR family transcriptional regulator [Tissierellia bacterium]|nr:FadR family transcriptional regulator [Tissierellia bacterium]